MSKVRWLTATFFALALAPSGLLAQESGTITGTVVDASTQQPLSGVQVFVIGTSRGTLTNQQGDYLIPNVPAGQQQIQATLIGYSQETQPVNVAAGGTATADFALAQSAVELDAIVVNAVTGEAERKRELGTNTATIQVDEIAKGPITSFTDLLTGRTAGVNLQGVAGTVGTSQRIRIRGANSLSLSNEPLIFVDGIAFSNSKEGIAVGGQDYSRLNDLNPDNIESIEVLKGPAASSLYGTAAANGVILITTKRGTSGPAQWNAYAEYGTITDETDYPDNVLAYQINDPSAPLFIPAGEPGEGLFNGGFIAEALGRDTAYVACTNVDAADGLCTQDAVVRFSPLNDPRITPFSTGQTTKYGMGVAGGGDAVTYYLAADREDEEGVIFYNEYDRTSLRANLGAQLTDKLDVQVTSGYIRSNLALNQNDNNIFSPLINGLMGLPVYLPLEEIEANTQPGTRISYGFGFSPEDIQNVITNQEVSRVLIGTNANYRPLPWLSANANFGLDYFSRFDHETVQPGRVPIGGAFTLGYRDSRRATSYIYTGSGSAVGTFDLSPSIVSTTTVGAQYNRELVEGTECFGAGIVQGTRSCGASSSLFEVDEDFFEVITIGGFLQQQFAFNDRLFLAGSLRGDDNSAFGQDFGFVLYPGASLSWVVSEEPFFPAQLSFLSNLRLRTAFGTSGLRPDFRDAVTLFSPVAVASEGEELSAVTLESVGNVDLEPERSTEWEFGADAGLFSNRLSVEFTYYNKKSKDALIRRQLPPSFGLTGESASSGSIFDNLGEISNQGIELAMNALVLNTNNAQLNFRVSATTLDNEIVELGRGIEPIVINRGEQRHQEGFPAGAFFLPPYTYEDADGNGKLSIDEVSIDDSRFTVVPGEDGPDTLDVAFIGPALPTNSQSFSADLTLFRYITVSTLFERRAGNYQLNGTESFRCGTGDGIIRVTGASGCPDVADPNASLEDQARFIASRYYGSDFGYVEKADFVKWRELSVTLGAPSALYRNIGFLEGASLTLSGRNLATWTDYSGIDPEINEQGGDTNFNQNEFNTQPPLRYLTARLNFTF